MEVDRLGSLRRLASIISQCQRGRDEFEISNRAIYPVLNYHRKKSKIRIKYRTLHGEILSEDEKHLDDPCQLRKYFNYSGTLDNYSSGHLRLVIVLNISHFQELLLVNYGVKWIIFLYVRVDKLMVDFIHFWNGYSDAFS
uniref:Pac protein n=1 Tax=Fopius arisanus TaxID=64838 RepID=A0A0C9Q299_9HYME